MIRMELEAAAGILGVSLDSQLAFTGITTDSRAVEPGMLFAALPGERVDGHDFVSQAEEAGAVAALVQRPVHSRVPQLRVGSVLHALGELATAWRDQLDPPVAAMTGSNGKTTTKEMLASILGQAGTVLATSGNYNNELGVPLTLFRLAPEHDFAVLEMGAGKAGDIRYLAGLAKPDVGVITNVSPAHLKGMGSVEGIARTKGEIYASLPTDGFAIFNIEEPWLPLWQERTTARNSLTFGFRDGADVRAVHDDGEGSWRIHTPGGSFELKLALPGKHNVSNALAATAMALALGIDLPAIQAGLADTRAVAGRLNRLVLGSGLTVIDDSYNANPASVRAALEVLAASDGETWAALGDMRELGDDSDGMHAELGVLAKQLGVARLYATGEHSRHLVEAFGVGARHFGRRQDLVETLLADLAEAGPAPRTCLVKGSRSLGMEAVVDALVRRYDGRDPSPRVEVG
ncbi:MAG: UDP-N-acetylmuramoyl-tripeptide--D-alanyl-D-alanine ligase [Xanthomonadales bacterium]|jgi:UDP-N-acetylmuramoyl-tripeptide--D-alanyl-D-alanine ligase|nr:UDP-N-acetylmuramoyl-tripeptide--D-alanyl-D-alanine ligase [Xanthomonadales bacterium]